MADLASGRYPDSEEEWLLDGSPLPPYRRTISRRDIATAFGEYAVDARGFQIAHKMVLHQWQNGKKVTVWPANVADGKPSYPTPPWTKR